ncbi:hypothetical protein SAMD00019534_102150 [Acytostelium subglobosum LB1]|uniref:hypothetical protein n=1 Tax=Acytostelium subglobosum LB1 TaxID=1410327 RepID=UPI0006447F74|nr:hypothetical protein SAMD00019534_102150 [Acytostelium subglobosum LB1]GAM27040.1 hypothetical protein SAMD00019534_102150 [Acytostelium subglobosum LB1]|eukprot:XP_012749920.1 hypothetical protein SAMD00019534_102150 [Acytostelium subglobosum LB1]
MDKQPNKKRKSSSSLSVSADSSSLTAPASPAPVPASPQSLFSSIIRTRSQTAAALAAAAEPSRTTPVLSTLSSSTTSTTSTTSTSSTSSGGSIRRTRSSTSSLAAASAPQVITPIIENTPPPTKKQKQKKGRTTTTTTTTTTSTAPAPATSTTSTTTTTAASATDNKRKKKQPALPQQPVKKRMTSKKSSINSSSNTDMSDDDQNASTSTTSTTTPPSTTTTATATSTTSTSSDNNNNNNNNNAASPGSSTLHGLMRGLTGALLDELAHSQGGFRGGSRDGLLNTLIEGRARLKQILQGMNSEDESIQMESLIELSELLAIATEETMAGFPSDLFAPALVNMLGAEHNPDMMLMACRALSNMIEALPGSVSAVVNHGAVGVLCAKLLSIEYIDLAEQSLQTLEKISIEQPTAVLRAGGLMAVLSYLDFFSTGVQRMAVSTAANICRQVPQDCFELVKDSVPILTNLLTYSDSKVVELACLCFSRLVDSFYDSDTKLQAITSDGLVTNLVRILSGMNNSSISLSPTTYTQVIRIMSSLCHGCPPLTLTLLQEGISSIIQAILQPNDSDPSAFNRSSQQCYEILSLINELLPPLPAEFSALLPNQRSVSRRKKETSEKDDPRIEMFKAHPDLLLAMGQGLFGVLVEMFTSTVNPVVRYKCLGCICKMLYFSTPAMLTELLKNFAFSSFLAGLLGSRDMTIVSNALKISEMMLDKLPEIFTLYFKREGVIYEIDRLSKLEPIINDAASSSSTSPSPTPSPTKSHGSAPISIPGTPQRAGIPPPLASSPFANSFFVGSPMQIPPSTPTSSTTTTASPTSPTQQTATDDMKSTVCREARRFKTKYFSKESTSATDSLSTDELKTLKNLSDRLNGCYNEAGIEVLQEISKCITTKEGVSAFEFLHSGLVSSILSYLTRGDVRKHVECFCKVFLVPIKLDERSAMVSSTSIKQQSGNSLLLLSLLVNKLHDALTKVERFAININDVGGTSTGLKYLAQPFKLKLSREGGDESLRDYAANVVLIEPLATITAIEEFLLSRVINKDVATSPTAAHSDSASEMKDSKSGSGKETKTDTEDDEEEYHDDYEDDELLQNQEDQAEGETEPVHDVKISDSLSSSGTIPPQTSTSASSSSSLATSTSATQPLSSSPTNTTPPQPHTPPSQQQQQAPSNKQKLAIFVDGQRLLPTFTIFQAVQKIAKSNVSPLVSNINNNNNNNNANNYYGIDQSNEGSVPTSRLWEGTHTLKYRYLTASEMDQPNSQSATTTTKPSIKGLGDENIIGFLEDGHSFPLSSNDTTYEIISLLRILYKLNMDSSYQAIYGADRTHVGQTEFISQKLTAKVMRQLQDPLALCGGALPDWCKQLLTYCPFLFPFECKRLFFYSTSFGIARALSTLQQRQDLIRQTSESSRNGNNNPGEVRVGRIPRQKVRIYRNRILDSAIKVMELYGKTKSILEVEYFGEVGTGLGPTLEFFTLVSREVRRKDLNLWYSDTESNAASTDASPYVFNAGGLFPKPVRPGTLPKKTLDYFKFLGTFVAKAFYDQRLVDLPFSKPFYKYMANKDLEFGDLAVIAPSMASSLNNLYALVLKIKAIKSSKSIDDQQKQTDIAALRIDGAKVDDLCLDFVLPGHPQWELKDNGSNISVNIFNLEEYLNLIVMNFLYSGVIQQVDAFKEGFNQIFPITSLFPFSVAEVESLLCGALTGSDSDWTVDALMESTKCDHGYTNSSIAVQNFFKIMSEFSTEERKQFLLFITGSPHLPIQGFKGLNPRLTIVKKHLNTLAAADDSLLSVMSCTNYIKLPDYSSRDIMKSKLLYAMKEGQSSFHLS